MSQGIDVSVVLSMAGLAVNAGMAIILSRVSATAKKLADAEAARKADLERADDLRRDELAAIEAKHTAAMRLVAEENHDLTVKLLDERDRRISHSLNNHAQQVTSAMDLLQRHVQSSDQRFLAMAAVRPELEKELMKTLGEAREFVRTSAASKVDFDRFCAETKDDRREIVQSITSLERKVVTVEDLKKVIEEIKR